MSSASHKLTISYDEQADEYDVKFETINVYLRSKSKTVDTAIPSIIDRAASRDQATVALGREDPRWRDLVRQIIGRTCLGWFSVVTKDEARQLAGVAESSGIWTPKK